jgi:hypothetical protein
MTMDERLEQVLVRDFPEIFRDYKGDIMQTCMGWGVECGNGWFDLVYDSCRRIENEVRWVREHNPELASFTVYFAQVKEKWASLTMYTHTDIGLPDTATIEEVNAAWEKTNAAQYRICGVTDMASTYSHRVCQNCGNHGRLRGGAWMHTHCDLCDGLYESGCKDDYQMRSTMFADKVLRYFEEKKREEDLC